MDANRQIDEVFVANLQAARLQESMGASFEEVVGAYLRASDSAPHRSEALWGASRRCGLSNKFAEGYEYARRGLTIERPADGLCVEDWIYDYGLLDEFAVNAYWAGAYQDCLDACERLLREGKIPSDERVRVTMNADFARQKLSFQIQREIRDAFSLLRPYGVDEFNKLRFGAAHDGGYILIDDFRGIDTALSFGIGCDSSWDEAISERHVTVYQFDPTIDSPPATDNRGLIFAKKKISGQAGPDSESLASLVTLHDKRNSHPNIMVKMDIENDEWTVFDQTSPEILARFCQIVVEFHFFNNPLDNYWRQIYARVFKKISDLYGVVHVHANNYGEFINVGNVMIPNVFEVTFANRSIYSFKDTDEIFPGPLDRPNNPTCPDMYLGSFRF